MSLDDLPLEHEDDDQNEESNVHEGPTNTAEKRQAQRAIFKSWALSKAEKITTEQIRKELVEKNDEELSIRNLLQKQERPNTIKNPRDYQLELFERAKQENTIAVLDTGSGKTLIAVLLLRHIIDEELERRAAGHRPRISFFLVCWESHRWSAYLERRQSLSPFPSALPP
jgi:endoribonuclease Dicer